jgi:hypothetical protein
MKAKKQNKQNYCNIFQYIRESFSFQKKRFDFKIYNDQLAMTFFLAVFIAVNAFFSNHIPLTILMECHAYIYDNLKIVFDEPSRPWLFFFLL